VFSGSRELECFVKLCFRLGKWEPECRFGLLSRSNLFFSFCGDGSQSIFWALGSHDLILSLSGNGSQSIFGLFRARVRVSLFGDGS
jgi:hypothetical protein